MIMMMMMIKFGTLYMICIRFTVFPALLSTVTMISKMSSK